MVCISGSLPWTGGHASNRWQRLPYELQQERGGLLREDDEFSPPSNWRVHIWQIDVNVGRADCGDTIPSSNEGGGGYSFGEGSRQFSLLSRRACGWLRSIDF